MATKIALYCDNNSAVLYDLGVQNISYYNNIIFMARIDTKGNSALQIPTITSEIMKDLIFMAQH